MSDINQPGEPHNHVTRDIKPPGVCPGCDVYHRSQGDGRRAEPSNGGESRNGGEYAVTAEADMKQRAELGLSLEAGGHAGCAIDLLDADDPDVVRVAYAIAEHVEMACGEPDFTADPELAARIRAWADAHEALDPAVPRKRPLRAFTHRDGDVMIVELRSDDILDLTGGDESVMTVTLTVDENPVFSFHRMGPSTEVTRDETGPPA